MEEEIKKISFICLVVITGKQVKPVLEFSKSKGYSSHSHDLLSDTASTKFLRIKISHHH